MQQLSYTYLFVSYPPVCYLGDEQPRLLGRYCRRDQEGLVITSAGNVAQITFRTDHSVNRTGIQINAKAGNHEFET